MLGLFLFQDSFANIVIITFTALILIEILNVYTSTHKMTFPMILMQLASILVYLISIVIFREYFDLGYLDLEFAVKVSIITMASWLPFQALTVMLNWLDPSDNQKIMAAKQ